MPSSLSAYRSTMSGPSADRVSTLAGSTTWLASQPMTTWEYATVPLLIHATKQILDTWGEDGWELVTVLPGPSGDSLVAYLKRPREA